MEEYIRRKGWHIAFAVSLILLGLVILFGYLGYSSTPIPEWAAWFQVFLLSLLASLIIWLGNRIWGKSSAGGGKGWKIAFWITLIPNGVLYYLLVYVTREVVSNDPPQWWGGWEFPIYMIGMLVYYAVHIVAVLVFFLQVWFALHAFSNTEQANQIKRR